MIPEAAVPTLGTLGVNRWALANDDGTFDTTSPHGKGPHRNYTIEDTDSCSCEQIIDMLDVGQGHRKHGCSISVMDDWQAEVERIRSL